MIQSRRVRLRPDTTFFFLLLFLAAAFGAVVSPGSTVAFYDFRQGDQGWRYIDNGSIADFACGPEGMTFRVVGEDPYVWGPPEEYPADKPVRLTFRMRSTGQPGGEIFYGSSFSPDRRIPFAVDNDGEWHNYQIELPVLGSGARIRIDPSNTSGEIAIAWVRTEVPVPSETVAFWDFTEGTHGWTGNFDVENLQVTAEGLDFDSVGIDPWLNSPAVQFSGTHALRFTVRMRSTASPPGRLFWGESGFSEERAIGIPVVADGAFHENSRILPALDGTQFLRFDPGVSVGHVTIEWIRIETADPFDPPPLAPPEHPQPGGEPPLTVSSGPLTLEHYRTSWGGFVLRIDGVEVASGNQGDILGFMDGDLPAFPELREGTLSVAKFAETLTERVAYVDRLGGRWILTRRITPGSVAGTLEMETTVSCDQDRELVHVPWLTLFPGLGTVGTNKTQALLAGVEYLADEPSSSEADLTVPEHVRIVPAPYKLTFPLYAVVLQGKCLGVFWRHDDLVAAVHDSPDRTYDSGAHLFALWAPGVGNGRDENALFVESSFPLDAGSVLSASYTILGAAGESVVPALRSYVAHEGLPPVPSPAGGVDEAVELLAAGWTLSSVYTGDGLWRHAAGTQFSPHPAADAVAYMMWMTSRNPTPATLSRLNDAIARGTEQLEQGDPAAAGGVAHVRWPSVNLVLGDLPLYLRGRRTNAYALLRGYDEEGILHYVPAPDKPDYSSTHWTDHANGYAAQRLSPVLEAAMLTGDADLVDEAIALLDKQTVLYARSVPRGAQTWEVPLHTPDVLAAAHLLKCYVIGYELTGRRDLLDEAIYWAWTGLPFIYLDPSTEGEVGDYAAIAVYGATNWVAPVWIGVPVQWCGLVYRSWLHRLAAHDPEGPWDQVARGITAGGILQTWPRSDTERRGLLPDAYSLTIQHRNDPGINPGTVQANLPEFFGLPPQYGFATEKTRGWWIHAPGPVTWLPSKEPAVAFAVSGWGDIPYRVLVVRVNEEPDAVEVSTPGGEPTDAAFDYLPEEGWLILEDLVGSVEIRIYPHGSKRGTFESY